jgi:hypothetical protein
LHESLIKTLVVFCVWRLAWCKTRKGFFQIDFESESLACMAFAEQFAMIMRRAHSLSL